MENLAYTPTKEEKKFIIKKIKNLTKSLRELGYDWEEVEEESVKAVNKYLSMLHGDLIIATFKTSLEIRELCWKWQREE